MRTVSENFLMLMILRMATSASIEVTRSHSRLTSRKIENCSSSDFSTSCELSDWGRWTLCWHDLNCVFAELKVCGWWQKQSYTWVPFRTNSYKRDLITFNQKIIKKVLFWWSWNICEDYVEEIKSSEGYKNTKVNFSHYNFNIFKLLCLL